MSRTHFLEPLEARIAPALVVANPLSDIVVGAGTSGTVIPLTHIFDSLVQFPGHTIVTLTLNLDSDLETPGIQSDFDPITPGDQLPQIVIELFDDEAPISVQNFLRYIENPDNAADYLDTFFHRSAEDFVIQGGGFNASNDPEDLAEHIEVFSDVHNEFSATRSNLTGTLAMAKTGLGPHTATSEWFINLKDNSGNLDNQNGGFTVFGRVAVGMNIVNKVADLPTINRGGAFDVLPVQNYDSDPDNRPSTPAPSPTTDQLIRIVGVDVQRPQERAGLAENITFTVSVAGATEGDPASAVVANVVDGSTLPSNHFREGTGFTVPAPANLPNGKVLTLDYTGTSSVVNVTVTATENGVSIQETFQVTVRPNLVGNYDADTLPQLAIPGDAGKVDFTVHNTGGADFNSNATFKLYLSLASDADPNATQLDDEDILIGTHTQLINLPSGGELKLEDIAVALDQKLFTENDGIYRLIVEIQPAVNADENPDNNVPELFSDDNVALDGSGHALTNQFGDISVSGFGSRKNVKLTYVEADGDTVTLSFKGEGRGRAILQDGEPNGKVNLEISGTNASTKLLASVSETGTDVENLGVEINNLDISSPIGNVQFGSVDTTGYITASSGIRSLTLGDVTGDRSLVIGFFPPFNSQKANITLGNVSDFSIESLQPLGKVTATKWLDTTGNTDSIVALSLSSLMIKNGDFNADLQLDGRRAISNFYVNGNVTDMNLTTNGGISKFTVVNELKTSNVVTHDNVGNVKVGGMTSSNFFVGTDVRPTTLNDFTERKTIKSFQIGTLAFGDATVAAAKISKIIVKGAPTVDNDDEIYGFVADAVKSYTREGLPKKLTNLNKAAVPDSSGDYSLVILDPSA